MKILAIGDLHGGFPEKLKNAIRKENPDLIVGLGDYTGIDAWRPYIKKFMKILAETGEYYPAKKYFGAKRYKQLVKKDYTAGKFVLDEINEFNKPCLIIFGNGDYYYYPFDKAFNKGDSLRPYDKYIKKLKNLKNLNYKILKFMGIRFLGFGGYMEPVNNIEFASEMAEQSEEHKKNLRRKLKRMLRVKKKLFSLGRKGADIFAMHYPPEGAFDIIKDKSNAFSGKSAGVREFKEAILKFKPKLVLCGHMHEYRGAKKLGNSIIVNPGEASKGKYAMIDYSGKKIKARFKE